MVFLLFAVAFSVRLYKIGEPPLDFAPIRQYQNVHIIRGIYYETNDSIPESKKRIASLNMERMGFVLEPRIIENAAVLGYRILGAEHLWVPRLLSVVFWIVGGVFLYLIAKMMFSNGTALLVSSFYLFLPYGILASRGIQPDPLMVMMMIFSVHRVLKYDSDPTRTNLFTAAVVTAAAVLIKPYCLFMIFGAFFSLAVLRMGFWKAAFNRDSIVFTIMIVIPAMAYYAYGLLSDVGFLGEHARGSFLPHLLVSPPFWKGWFLMIVDVTGFIALFLALAGLFKSEKGKTRALLLGLWTGYLLFGLSATFQIHTHNYYNMPLIPIIALSLGPIAAMVINGCSSLPPKRSILLAIGSSIFLVIIVSGLIMNKARLKSALAGHKDQLKAVATFIGVTPDFGRFLNSDFEQEVRIAREIGGRVQHSTKTVFLTPDFGRVIAYHGEFSGLPWPTSVSLYGRRMRGVDVPDIEKDFTPEYIRLLYQGKFIKYSPDFFIITAFDEFEKQADLRKALYSNFPVFVQNDDYLIFDMRKMSK